jgi:hypothetical protein
LRADRGSGQAVLVGVLAMHHRHPDFSPSATEPGTPDRTHRHRACTISGAANTCATTLEPTEVAGESPRDARASAAPDSAASSAAAPGPHRERRRSRAAYAVHRRRLAPRSASWST